MPEKTHSRLSASKAEGWINCAAMPRLCDKAGAKKSGKAASEGTAAHSLAESCYVIGEDPFDRIGDQLEADDILFEVTDEMAAAVDMYLKHINALTSRPGAIVWTEEKFELKGNKDVGGTVDFMAALDDTLDVVDFKYGRHVLVSAEDNIQMKVYAVGGMERLEEIAPEVLKGIETVRLTIIQPRCPDPDGEVVRTFVTTKANILAWKNIRLLPAAKRTENPKAEPFSGKWCRWCAANNPALCAEQNADIVAAVGVDIGIGKVTKVRAERVDDLTGETLPAKIGYELPSPDALTPLQISKVVSMVDTISKWGENVMLYAKRLLESGKKIPGYKLVTGRGGNRRWKDEKQAEDYLTEFLGAKAFNKKLITPAQAEKLMKGDEHICKLTIKPEGSVSIAADTDCRKEVKGRTADDDFSELYESDTGNDLI